MAGNRLFRRPGRKAAARSGQARVEDAGQGRLKVRRAFAIVPPAPCGSERRGEADPHGGGSYGERTGLQGAGVPGTGGALPESGERKTA